MASDLKYWDVFKDTRWIFDKLLERYKVKPWSFTGGWSSNAGSGGTEARGPWTRVYTGTTASSRGEYYFYAYGLNSGDATRSAVDYGKKLEIYFSLAVWGDDPECVRRFQLKHTTAEGALTGTGIGIEIDNYAVYGEAYGSLRGTVSLGTIPSDRLWRFKIVLVPGNRVEFWVNGSLGGVLTGDYVPTGNVSGGYIVFSIVNGATGGVDANLEMFHPFWIIQEW